jgi:hypothetical protein
MVHSGIAWFPADTGGGDLKKVQKASAGPGYSLCLYRSLRVVM